jgi:alcohol dehydrogenase class IV
VAGLMTNPGRPTDYMEVVGEGKKIAHPAAPWVAIPTTAGTGAEVTRNAVIGFPERKFKASIRSELLLPRVAIVDPQLGVEVPPEVTAASGMDALCQCIESYTSRNANPLTDGLATKGIELAAGSLRQAYQAGHDLDARESMAMAALISGITLTNAGLGAVHGFAAPLGANFPIPHGVVCAALLPGVLEANIAEARKAARQDLLDRYARIGRILSADRQLPAESALAACVEQTRSLCRDLSIPRLSRFGLSEAEIPAMVALAMQSSSMKYNPVALDAATLSNILRNSL